MTAGHALAFLLFAVVAAITPGPSNLLLTATGAAVGVRRGLPALFGQVAGMGLLLFLVAFGLGSLVFKSPLIIAGLKWGGIGFLLWLAWTMATAGRSEAPEHRGRWGFGRPRPFNGSTPRRGWSAPVPWGPISRAAGRTVLGAAVALSVLFIVAALPSVLSGWPQAPACSGRYGRSGARACSTGQWRHCSLGSILLFIW